MFKQFTRVARFNGVASSLNQNLARKMVSPISIRFQSTLNRDDVFNRSVTVLKTFELKNPNEKITLDSQFGRDLGMDSLDYNDALVALEEEFDVVFDDKVANEIQNVGEAVDYIVKNHLPEEELLDKEIR